MPRPQRPLYKARFNADKHLADAANLESDEYGPLNRAVQDRIRRFREDWRPGPSPGRRNEALRNTLIANLASDFQKLSGWTLKHKGDSPTYQQEYRRELHTFILIVLATRLIPCPVDRLPRLIPKAQRVPRP